MMTIMMMRITATRNLICNQKTRSQSLSLMFSCSQFSTTDQWHESENKNGNDVEGEKQKEVPISEVLRHAQALELFRRSYLFGFHAPNHISVSDIEDLMQNYRSRPSLLLGAYQLGGSALGMASRILPKDCSNTLNTIVQDATIQQFNDIIRDLQTTERHEDTKETIKYHRDLDTQIPTNNIPHTENGHNSSSTTSNNGSNSSVDAVAVAATTALYNLLKISKTI